MEQTLVKEKNKVAVKSKLSVKQKLVERVLQKQIQIVKLKEWLAVFGFVLSAATLRAVMQVAPSVEPITFFALLGGWLFGKKKGFLIGAGALYASNFLVFGGQGFWTPFQALGFGLAGVLGGLLSKKAKLWTVFLITILATIVFEIIINFGMFFLFPNLLAAIPFIIIHLVSNGIFSFLLPATKKLVYEKGRFNQKEICNRLLQRFENFKNGVKK